MHHYDRKGKGGKISKKGHKKGMGSWELGNKQFKRGKEVDAKPTHCK